MSKVFVVSVLEEPFYNNPMIAVANSIYIHDLQPFAIKFSENFGVRWYGLSYLGGFIAGFIVIYWLASKGKTSLPKERISDYVTIMAIGILAGGRVGYALFYSPDLITKFTSTFPYWGVLEVHKGGMASHGGIAGIIIAGIFFARKYKLSKLHLLDLTALCGGLGIFFGRLANFINGELYGREAHEGFKWAVKFPQEIYRWASIQPFKLKELGATVEAIGPITVSGGRNLNPNASEWTSWVNNYSNSFSRSSINVYLDQIIVAVQNGNQKVIEALGPVLTARYPSQLYQALMEGLFVFIILFFIWRKPRKPGVISAWFGVLYAVARIIGEQFRMPDAHIGYEFFGLTRGQILSFGMLAAVIVYLIIVIRRPVEPVGGWED